MFVKQISPEDRIHRILEPVHEFQNHEASIPVQDQLYKHIWMGEWNANYQEASY